MRVKAKAKDLLSGLPDDILHYIFSFLGDNNVVRLQALSRRFQNICFTSPSLCLSQRRRCRNCSCKSVFSFMNSLVQHRPHAFKINKLSFSSFCKKLRHRKLHNRWIHKLFQAFLVDELSVHYKLPSIFNCLSRFHSLKVLKLRMSFPVTVMKLPEIELASLETLYMKHIVNNDPIGEWISQSFPYLKRLFLTRIEMELDFMKTKQQELTIQSSCLEDLAIHYCCRYKIVRVITEKLRRFSYIKCQAYFCLHGVYDYGHLVEISAPNLESLTLKGPPEGLHCEGTFKNLNLAVVSKMNHVSTKLNMFIQLNEALRWARILHTDMCVLEGIYGIRETPISFQSVGHVQVRIGILWNGYDMGDVVSTFLERLPNLETLTLVNHSPWLLDSDEVHRFDEDIVRECRRYEWKKIKGLKKVEFIITSMDKRMAFLIGALKKWCVDLEEMILNYPPRDHKSVLRYLKGFEMASNYAPLSINFLPH